MITNLQTLALAVVLAIGPLRPIAWGQDVPAMVPRELRPADATSCVFAGREARFRYFGATGPVEWSLVAGNRTLRQGTTEPKAAGPNEAPQLVMSVPMPNLRAGVVLPAELRLTWGAGEGAHQHMQPVTIFSPDPISVRKASHAQAPIGLFDATGETVDVFERHDISHSRLRSLSAIDLMDRGVVIVGEGVSFREHRNLSAALLRAAERGVSVLCLAPVEGEFAFPQPDEATPGPSRVVLEQGDVVRRYDKRFDLLPTISRLAVEPSRSDLVVRASDSGAGWLWLRVDYAAPKPEAPPHRLIVCGISIVRDWESSPVPRYLLVHLLEDLTANQTDEENE